MKTTATASLLLVLTTGALAQLTPPRITAQARAEARSVNFLTAVGQAGIAQKAHSFSTQGKLTTVLYPMEASVTVDTVRGVVVSYRNQRRLAEQLSQGSSRGRYAIRSAEGVRKAARELAVDLGIPRSYILEGVGYYDRGDPRVADANREGVGSGSFAARPNGYSFYSRGMQVLFALDPLDGALMSLDRMDDSTIEPSKVRLDAKRAKAAATRLLGAKGYSVGASAEPKLAYTCPNGLFGGVDYGDARPYRLRLAYGFGISGKGRRGQAWIDAETGRLLGGFLFRSK